MSVHEQLARITNSPPLVSSPSLCRFLRYIVEETLAGRASGIKEQVLGLEVFDRGLGFNPRLDPIVRVQARNLRGRMAKYYEELGKTDPIRIELPKGTYVPVFRHVGSPDDAVFAEAAPLAGQAPVVGVTSLSVMPAPPPRSPVAATRRLRPRFMVAAMILVVILAGITVLWISRTHAAARVAAQADSLAQDLVIRGRYALDRQTESALREAIASFQHLGDTTRFLSLLDEMHFKG